jgi:hypothetical protein
MKLFRCSALLLLLGLSGCAMLRSGQGTAVGADVACDSMNLPEPSFLGLIKPPGARKAYQDYAEDAYLYAQMADNSYPRETLWVLPDSIRRVASVDDGSWTGFAASVFELGRTGSPSQVVIAFRGTEGGFLFGRDWRYGNWTTRQHMQAEAYYAAVRGMYPATIPITVTGHSLGGGLALQVSITQDSVPAYVFNTSYRVARHRPETESYRLSIAETGEALRGVRYVLANITLLHLPGYDCTEGGAGKNHGMTALARCLTRIAAARVPGAVESLERNRVTCPHHLAEAPWLSPPAGPWAEGEPRGVRPESGRS